MKNGSVPLKNNLVQHKSQTFIIVFLKAPIDYLDPGASLRWGQGREVIIEHSSSIDLIGVTEDKMVCQLHSSQ